MSDDVARIVLRADDERRLAPPQHRQSYRVHPGGVRHHTAVVAQLALAGEDRHLEPAIVRTKSGRPDDRADLAVSQIERQARRFGCLSRLETLRSADLDSE